MWEFRHSPPSWISLLMGGVFVGGGGGGWGSLQKLFFGGGGLERLSMVDALVPSHFLRCPISRRHYREIDWDVIVYYTRLGSRLKTSLRTVRTIKRWIIGTASCLLWLKLYPGSSPRLAKLRVRLAQHI